MEFVVVNRLLPWASSVTWLSRLPVTEKITGSNPVWPAFGTPKRTYGVAKPAVGTRRRLPSVRRSFSEGDFRYASLNLQHPYGVAKPDQ